MFLKRADRLKAKLDNVLQTVVRNTVLVSAVSADLLPNWSWFVCRDQQRLRHGDPCLVFGAFFLLISIIAAVSIVAARSRNRSRAGRLAEELTHWRDSVADDAALVQQKVQSGIAAAVATTRQLLMRVGTGLRSSIETRPFTAVALVFTTGVLMGVVARHLIRTTNR